MPRSEIGSAPTAGRFLEKLVVGTGLGSSHEEQLAFILKVMREMVQGVGSWSMG